MNRFLGGLCILCLLFFSCTTSPSVSSPDGMVKYGSGSIEDDRGDANKASPASGIQKVKLEETLSRATLLQADIDGKLASREYEGAFASFDLLVTLLSGIPAGNEKMQETRGKLEKALDLIAFETVTAPAETVAGTAFKKDYSVRIFTVNGEEKKPLGNSTCIIVYPSVADDGSKTTLTQSVLSTADGLVVFSAPVPAVSGKNTVSISLALNSTDFIMQESLALRKENGQLSSVIPHTVSTNAKKLATTISILDYNQNGKAILSGNPSATALLKPLVQKGFGRIGMADFPTQLASGDEAALIKAAKAMFGTAVQRFIFGTARIESLAKGDDGLWSCTFVLQVNVWDFGKGEKIYSGEIRTVQKGKTESAAIDAARKKACAEQLVDALYYNM